MSNFSLEDIVSLCKRRGFIFPGSEIYGGLSGTWDYGPLGVSLKRNIENLWWHYFVEGREDMYGLDSAILMNPKVWLASGHVDTFNDPLIEDVVTKKRYRLDHLLEEQGIDTEGLDFQQMVKLINEKNIKSPNGNVLGSPAQFNMMFKTHYGAVDDDSSVVYLRPETAQGMFVNFRNIIDTFYPDLPFGIAQVGRSFRNEIAPRDFVFRSRELELMEFEYFCQPSDWEALFDKLLQDQRHWYINVLGLSKDKLTEKEISQQERAHYSNKTIDFEYAYPIGVKEIGGFAYRTDYDLSNHQKLSGKSMEYVVKGSNDSFIPHVLEPTFGLDRHVLAVLCEAYEVDEVNGEKRVVLRLSPKLAPYKVAISPLLKNKQELVNKARTVFNDIKSIYPNITWDDNGNIGKRYRRQDEIGTPYCVTIDFTTLEDDSVTVRDRDTTKQERIQIKELSDYFSNKLNY
ncbi:MAG: glycine--tRNA ligase [Candidatus Saccharimonadales bacterium]